MCCSASKWKREQVKDHKFDFVDVQEFKKDSVYYRIKHSFVFFIVLKSVLVYIADIWTAGYLLVFNHWSSSVNPKIPFYIAKWIYVGCIFASFILLFLDFRKANYIYNTRDISFAFTSGIAYKYYTLGWKRLVFAEAPRQAISAFTLYSIVPLSQAKKYYDIASYGEDTIQRLVIVLMAFSLFIFLISAIKLISAVLLYIPLKKTLSIRPTLPEIDDNNSSLPPYHQPSPSPYSENFIPDTTRSSTPEQIMMGPPPYISRTTTPNYGSRTTTPNYGSRAATQNYGHPGQRPLYHADTTDYPKQPYPNNRTHYPNPERSHNNIGPASEPIPVIRQNQRDPIIAPQPMLPNMGHPRPPYPPNNGSPQPNFIPMNQSNVIVPECSYNNLESISEPVHIVQQNQYDPIIASQATSQPDMGHYRQPYPNNGSPQPNPIPINQSNVNASDYSYNAFSEPITLVRQNQHDPIIAPQATSQPIFSNTGYPRQPYPNNRSPQPNPFPINQSNVPVIRQNQHELITPQTTMQSINRSGYIPNTFNEVHNDYHGDNAPISEVIDDDRDSYASYRGYYNSQPINVNDDINVSDIRYDVMLQPPQRSYSPSDSLSYIGSNSAKIIPSRYQQPEEMTSRFNNYIQSNINEQNDNST
ncbi:pheromone-regulated K+ transporter prm6 [Gigaspora margarita]|uniref:Pheromone-regulated K+ transporter prm6 n=1 Tax=Gigaspora margarita TaxID=4874 RepID=A0A8H4ASD4_GIGMA|nr:pheromone-regulated K+ transporter prm6 [Gigaspora margarita]